MILLFQNSIVRTVLNDRSNNSDNPKELSCLKNRRDDKTVLKKDELGYHTREVSSTKSDRMKATVKGDERDTMMTILSKSLSSSNREC